MADVVTEALGVGVGEMVALGDVVELGVAEGVGVPEGVPDEVRTARGVRTEREVRGRVTAGRRGVAGRGEDAEEGMGLQRQNTSQTSRTAHALTGWQTMPRPRESLYIPISVGTLMPERRPPHNAAKCLHVLAIRTSSSPPPLQLHCADHCNHPTKYEP